MQQNNPKLLAGPAVARKQGLSTFAKVLWVLVVLVVLPFFLLLSWRVATSLSSDALGMAVGLVFGALAGLPTVLLVLASNRRPRRREDEEEDPEVVIVVGGQQTTAFPIAAQPSPEWPQQPRSFRVVGQRQLIPPTVDENGKAIDDGDTYGTGYTGSF